MKNLYKIAVFLFAFSLTIVGCEKDMEDSVQNEIQRSISNSKIQYSLDNLSSAMSKIAKESLKKVKSNDSYQYDYQLLMTNPDDIDDARINRLLFKLAEATKGLIKNIEFNQLIINMALESENESANLLNLETVSPTFFNIINQNLSSYGLSLQLISDSLTHNPVAPNLEFPETAATEYYVPSIFIPNLESLNSSLQPLISPNVEVISYNDETIEDNIIAWYYQDDSSTSINEIVIGENESLISQNPLFLLDNAVASLESPINYDAVPYYGVDSLIYEDSLQNESIRSKNFNFTDLPQPTSTKSFSSYEHSIKGSAYRYEPWTSGKSEFAITGKRIDQNGGVHSIYPKDWQLINKISRSDASNSRMQHEWRFHASNWQPWYNSWFFPSTQTNVNFVFWNTFERDWNRSNKHLGNFFGNGKAVGLFGRRKYNSEWYAWIPSTLWVHNTQFVWIDFYWAHWNNSYKSDFRIWKVFI